MEKLIQEKLIQQISRTPAEKKARVAEAIQETYIYKLILVNPQWKGLPIKDCILNHLQVDTLQKFAYAYDHLNNRGEAQQIGRYYANELKKHLQNLGIAAPTQGEMQKSDRLTKLRYLFNAIYDIEDTDSYYRNLTDVIIYLENIKLLYKPARNMDWIQKIIELCHFLQKFCEETTRVYINHITYCPSRGIRESMIKFLLNTVQLFSFFQVAN